MRLTKQTSYAIRILIHCVAANKQYVRARDIASLDGITEYNVAKIVPLLVRGGFLTTSRGRAPEDSNLPGRLRRSISAMCSA